MSSSSSSNRSTTIPLSFDRFRGRSLQLLSPFRYHHHDKSTKQSPERSWTRKIQVHPNEGQPTEPNQIDYNITHLFQANSKTLQNKKCSKNLFDTRSTSNAIGVMNSSKHRDVLGHTYPPTPCMIGYRQSSLPNLLPTCVTKRPKTFSDLFKQSDVDHRNA